MKNDSIILNTVWLLAVSVIVYQITESYTATIVLTLGMLIAYKLLKGGQK